jgi:serine/threonine protein kinase
VFSPGGSRSFEAYRFPQIVTSASALSGPEWMGARELASDSLLKPACFTWRRLVGHGGTATVWVGFHSVVGKMFAIKEVEKRFMEVHKLVPTIQREVFLLSFLDGMDGFAPKLYGVGDDKHHLCLYMEIALGGSLRDLGKREGRISEGAARFYAVHVAHALQLLHDSGYLHGDIKPRNVMLDHRGHVKLVDFGSVRRVVFDKSAGGFCRVPPGHTWITPEFAPHELLAREAYDPSVDWFSLGGVLYYLLTGRPPFGHSKQRAAFEERVEQGLRESFPVDLSPLCVSFVVQLLRTRPGRRMSFEQVKRHPWLVDVDWDLVARRQYHAPFLPLLPHRTSCLRYFTREKTEKAPVVAGARSPSSLTALDFPMSSKVRAPLRTRPNTAEKGDGTHRSRRR